MTAQGEPEFEDWATVDLAISDPPVECLRWVDQQIGESVTSIQALVGGLSSAVHKLEFTSHEPVVLRRYTLADWIEREQYIPHDEARNLRMLGSLDLGVATPTLIAADPDGLHCDVPAIIMSEVPGQPQIDPTDPGEWSDRLAQCLVDIHRQPPVADLPMYRRWDSPDRPVPSWTTMPDLWRAAAIEARADLPQHPDGFLHRDYHPNNVHWMDDEICGVVDWLSACTGPLAADLAHCRWNLAVLLGPDQATRFTEYYRTATGYSEDIRMFDLSVAMSGPVGPFPTHAWNSLGRTDLTSEVVGRRFDRWLELVFES